MKWIKGQPVSWKDSAGIKDCGYVVDPVEKHGMITVRSYTPTEVKRGKIVYLDVSIHVSCIVWASTAHLLQKYDHSEDTTPRMNPRRAFELLYDVILMRAHNIPAEYFEDVTTKLDALHSVMVDSPDGPTEWETMMDGFQLLAEVESRVC